MNRTGPKALEVRERIAGIANLQVDPVVDVFQEQLAAVLVIAFADLNDWAADIGQVI